MHEQSSPEKSGEFARLDGAILGLLIYTDTQRPWSDAEVARAVSVPGDVPDGLSRLYRARLIHRWDALVSATRAAVHFSDIRETDDLDTQDDRHMEGRILELLLVPPGHIRTALSDREMRRAIGIKSRKTKLTFADAVNRLYRVGLVDRSGGLSSASSAAVRFDQIITL
jgi:hypothetical protein